MLDLKILEAIDKSKMFQIYDQWPELAESYYSKPFEKIKCQIPSHIIFAGMGGSGTICDLFAAILSKTDIHVDVVKGYHLPKTTKSDTLLVCVSVSGNTVETKTVLNEGISFGCDIIAFSNNGEIQNICLENNVEYRKIEMHHSPRASLIPYLFSMLKVLLPVLPIQEDDVIEAINGLKETGKEINSKNLIGNNNPALNLAEWIKHFPIIYYPWGLQAAAIRFKNSIQENAKMHVMTEDVIEACHNGIVGWESKSENQPILIRGDDDYEKTKERWELLELFFDEKNIDYKEISSGKGSILTKLVRLVYLLDFASIYLAVINKSDPTPIDSIDYIKNKLM